MGNVTLQTIDAYVASVTHIHVAIKGPHRSGKTTLAAAASRVWAPALLIDVEGGYLSAAPFLPKKDVFLAQVRPKDSTDHEAFFSNLGEAVAEAESGKYNLVVVDSLSEIASRMSDQYAQESKAGLPTQADWFRMTDRVRRFSRRMRDIRCHSIVTMLTKPVDRENGSAIYDVALSGKLAAEIPSMFDVLGLTAKRTEKGVDKHVFITSGSSLLQVGSRMHGLAPEEEVPQAAPWQVWEKMDKLHKALSQSSSSAVK